MYLTFGYWGVQAALDIPNIRPLKFNGYHKHHAIPSFHGIHRINKDVPLHPGLSHLNPTPRYKITHDSPFGVQLRGLQFTTLSPVSHLTTVIYTAPLREQNSPKKCLDALFFKTTCG
jgi:hypothetical protein